MNDHFIPSHHTRWQIFKSFHLDFIPFLQFFEDFYRKYPAIIVTIRDEISGEDGCDDRVMGARLTPFEGSVTNGEIRNGGWRWRDDDGGTFNGSKNLHNTRLMYTPPPLLSPPPPRRSKYRLSERLCARQTPKLRIGRTLSMAPVAIFFVRDAQMHRAFDNWSGTNDISFASVVRCLSFYKLLDCQTVADCKETLLQIPQLERSSHVIVVYIFVSKLSKEFVEIATSWRKIEHRRYSVISISFSTILTR